MQMFYLDKTKAGIYQTFQAMTPDQRQERIAQMRHLVEAEPDPTRRTSLQYGLQCGIEVDRDLRKAEAERQEEGDVRRKAIEQEVERQTSEPKDPESKAEPMLSAKNFRALINVAGICAAGGVLNEAAKMFKALSESGIAPYLIGFGCIVLAAIFLIRVKFEGPRPEEPKAKTESNLPAKQHTLIVNQIIINQ
jgi:hypothetical protein